MKQSLKISPHADALRRKHVLNKKHPLLGFFTYGPAGNSLRAQRAEVSGRKVGLDAATTKTLTNKRPATHTSCSWWCECDNSSLYRDTPTNRQPNKTNPYIGYLTHSNPSVQFLSDAGVKVDADVGADVDYSDNLSDDCNDCDAYAGSISNGDK